MECGHSDIRVVGGEASLLEGDHQHNEEGEGGEVVGGGISGGGGVVGGGDGLRE